MFVLVLDAPDEPAGAADKSDVPAAPTPRPRSGLADLLRAAHHDGPTHRQSSLSLMAAAAAVATGQ